MYIFIVMKIEQKRKNGYRSSTTAPVSISIPLVYIIFNAFVAVGVTHTFCSMFIFCNYVKQVAHTS